MRFKKYTTRYKHQKTIKLTKCVPSCYSSIFAIQKLRIRFMLVPFTRLGPSNILDDKPASITIASSVIFVNEEFSAKSGFPCKKNKFKLTLCVITFYTVMDSLIIS